MWPRRQVVLIAALGLLSLVPLIEARAQAFNIDLDIFSGTPAQGNGAPSSSFGAAAGQAGHWNRISAVVGGTMPIQTVDGQTLGVTMTVEGASGFGLGFLNATNTGDFALLLNDSATVNTIGSPGNLRYTFSGLAPGVYDVFTYAVVPQGVYCETPIFVPQATESHLQLVTGPMPGNSFALGVTHSKHRAIVGASGMLEVLSQPPPATTVTSEINGLQIVPVPETNSVTVLLVAIVLWLVTKHHRKMTQKWFAK